MLEGVGEEPAGVGARGEHLDAGLPVTHQLWSQRPVGRPLIGRTNFVIRDGIQC